MNKRSIQTRSDITRIFLKLLSQKSLKSITVKEISDGAGVTRATFYAHYHDIYDLLEQSRDEAVDYINMLIERSFTAGSFETFMEEFFTYFENRQELFALILGENGDMAFLVNTLRKLREHKDALIIEHNGGLLGLGLPDHNLSDFQFIYLAGGVLNVLTTWIAQEDRMPVKEISALTARFVENTCLVNIDS